MNNAMSAFEAEVAVKIKARPRHGGLSPGAGELDNLSGPGGVGARERLPVRSIGRRGSHVAPRWRESGFEPSVPRMMDVDLGRQVPALIAVFEQAGTAVTLQRGTKVIRPYRDPEFP